MRWVFGRYGEADEPGWTAPARDELSEHITEHFLTLVPPETAAAILGGVAPKLREDLVLIDAGSLHLRAKVADLLVEAPSSRRPRTGSPACVSSRAAPPPPTRGSRSRRP